MAFVELVKSFLQIILGVAQRKPPRINWKQENIEKTFLEACLHEITVNGREGNSLKVNSWKNVGQRLQKEHDFDANQRQMKNRYDYLKAKFGAWLKLRNKSGNVYDPIKNKFNLEEEEWQMEIKVVSFIYENYHCVSSIFINYSYILEIFLNSRTNTCKH